MCSLRTLLLIFMPNNLIRDYTAKLVTKRLKTDKQAAFFCNCLMESYDNIINNLRRQATPPEFLILVH